MLSHRLSVRFVSTVLSLIALFFALPSWGFDPPASGTILTVRINGIRNTKGQMVVELFDQGKGFPTDKSKAAVVQTVDLADHVAGTPLVVLFKDLKPGSYAVGCYHDENKNGKLDTKFLGIPREGVACSNDPRPSFRSPNFKESRFDLLDVGKSVDVKMWYQ